MTRNGISFLLRPCNLKVLVVCKEFIILYDDTRTIIQYYSNQTELLKHIRHIVLQERGLTQNGY